MVSLRWNVVGLMCCAKARGLETVTIMTRKTRSRATANLNVGLPAYKNAFAAWALAPPVYPLITKLGPVVDDYRSVTPEGLEACAGFVEQLLGAGLSSGVAQLSKLEQAIQQVVSLNPALLRPEDTSPDDLAHRVATHTQQVLSLLRYLKAEDTCSLRRHSKTGAVRRKATTEHWSRVHALIQKIDDVACETRASSVDCSLAASDDDNPFYAPRCSQLGDEARQA